MIDEITQHKEVMAKALLILLYLVSSTVTDDDATIFSFIEISRLGSFK